MSQREKKAEGALGGIGVKRASNAKYARDHENVPVLARIVGDSKKRSRKRVKAGKRRINIKWGSIRGGRCHQREKRLWANRNIRAENSPCELKTKGLLGRGGTGGLVEDYAWGYSTVPKEWGFNTQRREKNSSTLHRKLGSQSYWGNRRGDR